jgi:glutamine---fructose-6-phosphate transaminase (isomerizing)
MIPAMSSELRRTMDRQPADLRRIFADPAPAEEAAERLRDRTVFIVGTGTSWHAANHSGYLLRAAGVDARPVEAFDAAIGGPMPVAGDALLLLSHRNTKRYATVVRERAAALGVPTVVITGIGAGGDIETVEGETTAAFTASHLGALARVAQIAVALGANLGDLGVVPDAVEAALAGPGPQVKAPQRLLEYTGSGTNAWTAAEGALKVRETAYIAAEGLSAEQLYHGPSVALRPGDTLVALDGGGPGGERVLEIAAGAERFGVGVHRISEHGIGEPLSFFPLTVAVQRIALEVAEEIGTNPDSFGKDRPGAVDAWGSIGL